MPPDRSAPRAGDRPPSPRTPPSARGRLAASGGRPPRAVSEQTAGRIIDAAKTLFLREGYEKTSMDALAAALGMSKRTLYARFPGKAELFRAVVHSVAKSHLLATESIDVARRSLRSQLLAVGGRLIEAVLDPDMVAIERVIAGEAHQFPELATPLSDLRSDRVNGLVAGLLRHSGVRGRMGNAEARRDAEIFVALVALPPLRRAVLRAGDHDDPEQAARMLRRRVDIFLHGIAGAGRQQ